jgi:carbon monoxide dehydrogenase subunit G
MKIENSFEVPLPAERAWDVLMDIERIAPCMPGAELVETLPDNAYRGKVSVKLGPLAVTFLGTARFETIDRMAKRATIKASGNEIKGRGGAQAQVRFHMAETSPDLTRVAIETDLTLNGAVAQYGRAAGVIADISQQIIDKFAAVLKARIETEGFGSATPIADVAPAVPTTSTADRTVPAGASAPMAASVMDRPQPDRVSTSQQPSVPISGFSLLLGALWRSLKRLFR